MNRNRSNINNVARMKELNTGFPTRPGKARKIAVGRQKRNKHKKEHLPERTRTGLG